MDEDLNSILNDEPTPEASEPEAPQTEQSERARDPATGKFVSASDPGDENPEPSPAPEAAPPAAQQDAEPGHIPVAALRDERQKRQQLEEQLRQYEAYYASQQQPQQQYQQPQQSEAPYIPHPTDDPEGFARAVFQGALEYARSQIMPEVKQYGSQVETSNLVKVTQALARQRHEDYDTVVSGPFMEAVGANPMLEQQLRQHEDPAEYAYRVGKQWEQAKQFGNAALPSLAELEAKAEANVRERMMAELGLSQSKPTAPSSLASERSVGSRSAPAWGGPPTLNELLG